MGGHVTVGVPGYGEVGPQVESGKLGALALSSAERLPGIDIPTLKEQGIDVAFFNWRGLFAAPDVPAENLAALEGALDGMGKSQARKDTIAERQWTDLYMPAAEFKTFPAEDREVMKGILTDLGLAK